MAPERQENIKSRRLITLDTGRKLEYQVIWEFYEGPILKGYEIHHKDGNHLNNDIFNLDLKTRKEHKLIHAKIKRDLRKINIYISTLLLLYN